MDFAMGRAVPEASTWVVCCSDSRALALAAISPLCLVLKSKFIRKIAGSRRKCRAARRVGARLNHATKLRSPAWPPSVEESEQLAELRRILAAKPQQSRLQFFGGVDGPRPHILGESERSVATRHDRFTWGPDVRCAQTGIIRCRRPNGTYRRDPAVRRFRLL